MINFYSRRIIFLCCMTALFISGVHIRLLVAEEKTPETPSKTACEITQSRIEQQLKYAEINALNAKAELDLFKANHETSMHACAASSERQSADLDRCRTQTLELGERFNTAQDERIKLQKELLELRNKTTNAENSVNGDVQKWKGEAIAAKKRVADLEAKEISLRAEMEKYNSQKQEISSEIDKKNAELAAAKRQQEEMERKMEKMLADINSKVSSAETQDTYIFSKVRLLKSVKSVYQLYRSIIIYLISFIPEDTWSKAGKIYMDLSETVFGYVQTAQPYTEPIFTVAMNQFETFSSFYRLHLSSIVNQQVEMVGNLLCKGTDITCGYLSQMNDYIDEKLQAFFVAHPEMRSQIPSNLLDRVLCLIFSLVVLYIAAKFACFALRYIAIPILRSACVCCRKRRSMKSVKLQKTNKKVFTPAVGQSTKKFKDGGNSSNSGTPKKVIA